jgi:Family of unknown function (DUF6055)
MRRTLAATSVALSLALSATPALVSAADEGAASRPATAQQSRAAEGAAHERATEALARAKALFGSTAGERSHGRAGGPHRDATLVLRDLSRGLDALSTAQRREARAILARPTQGPLEDQDSYSVRSVKKCQDNICLHWVNRSKDRPPSKAWALKMLALMNKVWDREVGGLGYRRPLSDDGRGGNNKFDVYLAQIGDRNLYGYCTPERTRPGLDIANGYCVLDNDFKEFAPTPPMAAAKATAAHEFFHAIQFAYDYAEDGWIMESTATWMEERVFDDVNDNRQYLPDSQLVEPAYPLDYISPASNSIYGNWVFFEFLSTSFGKGVVKRIWNKAGAFAGAPDMYSTQAIKHVLKSRGGFVKAYTRFVGANVLPAKFYPEGNSWPAALPPQVTLTSASRGAERGYDELLHMSSLTWRVNSSPSLTGSEFRLRIAVDGPALFRMPGAHVLLLRHDGSVKRYLVRLNDNGNGRLEVPFDYASVAAVYVSMVNASTRFKCGKRLPYSCNGLPIDDGQTVHGQPYWFTASVIEST